MRKGSRNDVNYMEFRDGYVLVERAELEAIIEGYKRRKLKRNELRLYAAMCEQKGLHKRSKVDIARTLNCKSERKGIRRLSRGMIEKAQTKVRAIVDSSPQSDSERRIAVSRRMLKHAARGGSTSNEIIVMLYYCLRRLRQDRRLDRLEENERYARFTYRELEKESGIPRANICRAIKRLGTKGIVNTVWVHKQNENKFGMLFVDGPLVSLSCPRQRLDRHERTKFVPNKTTTVSFQIDNTPQRESTTLRNDNPKTLNQEGRKRVFTQRAIAVPSRQAEFERILLRAKQMKAEWVEQAA